MNKIRGLVKRPALRYHGGKWMLAPWIISHFPEHRIYVEPYGGGASVLLRKDPSYAEVYNDLDDEIVNVFKVARHDGILLQDWLQKTPFARTEFVGAYSKNNTNIEQARNTIVKSFMGFGSDAIRNKSGFRANANRSGTTPAHDWKNYGDVFHFLVERLRAVVIENKDAIEIIKQHDSEKTFFYVDPPYPHSTRTSGKRYGYEMSDDDHRKLADVLHNVKGKVLISTYQSDLYDQIYKGWKKYEREALADGARKRTEILYANY